MTKKCTAATRSKEVQGFHNLPPEILYLQPEEEANPLASSWGAIQDYLKRGGIKDLKKREAVIN